MHTAIGLEEFGTRIRQIIAQCTGITVCVGITPTKTLAKLANHGAKKWSATGGIADLTDPNRQHKLMKLVSVGEIWGVGRRLRLMAYRQRLIWRAPILKAFASSIPLFWNAPFES